MFKFDDSNPASEASVLEFERKLGRQLPADFRRFALETNGGFPDAVIDQWYVQFIFPLDDPTSNPLEKKRLFPYKLPENILPFGLEGQGDCFLINLDSSSILLWDHEKPVPSDGKLGHNDFTFIADGVFEFLHLFR